MIKPKNQGTEGQGKVVRRGCKRSFEPTARMVRKMDKRTLDSRLSFPATGPPDPGRASEGVSEGVSEGF